MMEVLGLKYVDIASKTEIPERTITSFIWENKPLGGQLLRKIHTKFSVSLDWLLSGTGSMLLNKTSEPAAAYAVTPGADSRTIRMCSFIQQFMSTASPDEQVWLEMQLKIHVPQYLRFLEQHHE